MLSFQLSAIRNLVIPMQNKTAVIDAGLVDIIVPMLNIYQPPVVFKALGTLRMLIDEQEELSAKLLGNADLIERLVDWAGKTPDMVGVNSEASRLVAWLVKNAYRSRSLESSNSSASLKTFISVNGAVDVLVKMLTAVHVVMQNEAVFSLAIITVPNISSTTYIDMLINANLAESLQEFIRKISETERVTNEIIDNYSTFITVLKKNEQMKKYLEEKKIDVNSIPRVKELATL